MITTKPMTKKLSLRARIHKLEMDITDDEGHFIKGTDCWDIHALRIIQALVDRLGKADLGLRYIAYHSWDDNGHGLEKCVKQTLKSISLEATEND